MIFEPRRLTEQQANDIIEDMTRELGIVKKDRR